jgi:hypothetical protein
MGFESFSMNAKPRSEPFCLRTASKGSNLSRDYIRRVVDRRFQDTVGRMTDEPSAPVFQYMPCMGFKPHLSPAAVEIVRSGIDLLEKPTSFP